MRFDIRRFATGCYILAGTMIAAWAESYLIVIRQFLYGKTRFGIFEIPMSMMIKGMTRLPLFFYLSMALGVLLIIYSFLVIRPTYAYSEDSIFIDNCDNDRYNYGWLFLGSYGIIVLMGLSYDAIKTQQWDFKYVVLFGIIFVFLIIGAWFGMYNTISYMRNYIIDKSGVEIQYPSGKRRYFPWDDYDKISFEKLRNKTGLTAGYVLYIWHKNAGFLRSEDPKNITLFWYPGYFDRIFDFIPERLNGMIKDMPAGYGDFNEERDNPFEKKGGKQLAGIAVIIYIFIAGILAYFLK